MTEDATSDTAVEQEPQEATAPEETTTEIVTEAEQPSGAPTASVRPQARPNRPAPAPEPEPAQTETATATPEPAADPLADAVADAVASALSGGTTTPEPDLPVGPPMTGGEKDALRVAVQRCWVVDVGSQSANVTVVVGMEMEDTGRVVTNSLRMVSSSGGSGSAVDTAFQAARRAILRCQGDGYDLPADKYAQWKEIEMVFDPSGMRLR